MLMALCLPAKLEEDIVMSALQKYVKLNEIQDVDEVCPELLDAQLQWEEESTGFPAVPVYLRKGCDIIDESTKRKPKKNIKKYYDYCYACKS